MAKETITIPAMFAPYIMDALIVASTHDNSMMLKANHAGRNDTADYYRGQLAYYRDAYETVRRAYH